MKENKIEKASNENISLTIASLIAFFIFGILLIIFYVKEDSILLAFFGSVVGSFFSGCISFIVMYFTNKAGRENVEKTLEHNAKISDSEGKLLIKPYIWIESISDECEKPDITVCFCTQECPDPDIKKGWTNSLRLREISAIMCIIQ